MGSQSGSGDSIGARAAIVRACAALDRFYGFALNGHRALPLHGRLKRLGGFGCGWSLVIGRRGGSRRSLAAAAVCASRPAESKE
jgi:hypothetical protein